MRATKLAQSGGAHFLAHFDEDLRVETETAALGDHRCERGDVDAVLPFIVGSPAPVDALALDRHEPRGKPRPPQIVEAADRVAMPVDQNRERGSFLAPLGHEKRRTGWVVENARRKSERSKARHHLVVKIAAQFARAFRFLARAGDGDPPLQIDEKFAAVEIGLRAGNGGGAAHAYILQRLRA